MEGARTVIGFVCPETSVVVLHLPPTSKGSPVVKCDLQPALAYSGQCAELPPGGAKKPVVFIRGPMHFLCIFHSTPVDRPG